MATIVDSYSESNQDDYWTLVADYDHEHGQSFTGNGGTLGSATFYVAPENSPTGNAYAKIYAHSGVFGTSSVPTGSAIATSDPVDVSTFPIGFSLVNFYFTGVNQITLTNATKYIVSLEYSGGDAGSFIDIIHGVDASTPSHGGNISYYDGITWTADSGYDMIFYVYEYEAPSTTIKDIIGGGFINYPR